MGVLANRFQQSEPWLSVHTCFLQDQVLVHEGLEAIENFALQRARRGANTFGCLKRAAARKYTQPCEQRALVWLEQIVAPVDRAAQCLLARRVVGLAAGQYPQTLIEALQERLRRECLDPGGGEFQRQRQGPGPHT